MPPRAAWTICFSRPTQANLPVPAMNFDRLVQSLYMTAAVQMGAGSAPNEQPRIDILGARQSIDMLSVLDEKTKGNLTRAGEAAVAECALRSAHVVSRDHECHCQFCPAASASRQTPLTHFC